ncbi:MAG: DUF885 domain-containing protein [bacterium]|nr:MAG: DUF885 domain-containing protein [bacterium]
MNRILVVFLIPFLWISPIGFTQEDQSWVQRSNDNSRILLEIVAKTAPESAAEIGMSGFDDRIVDLTPGFEEREITMLENALVAFQQRLAEENHPAVQQDLEILIESARFSIEEINLQKKYELPYYNVSGIIYRGIRTLLDEQVAPERRKASLKRLRKYAGIEPGYTPLTQLAQSNLQEHLKQSGLMAPVKEEIERDLANGPRYLAELKDLFDTYKIKGYEDPLRKLNKQILDYEDFIREVLLPGARTDFRLPQEVYSFRLRNRYGVDMPLDILEQRAKTEFRELQVHMQTLAQEIIKQKNLTARDYREVLRIVKAEQFEGEEILPVYRTMQDSIEIVVKREKIVSLPKRDIIIRLASEAESAAVPSPHMNPPRLIGNTGEMGEFILPLQYFGKEGESNLRMDDFTFRAVAWPLIVHEGRPGHELQFASVVEKGVSLARVLFAMNSVNVEGWALYMENEMLPYLPLEGQLSTLWSRLARSARAFLDPGLQSGKITPEQVLKILREDVCVSEALAQSELERYTFRAPGQATSYYCGYVRMMELRMDTELLMGDTFNRQSYHDFLLSQGTLPPRLLRKAVMEQFVGGK